MNAASPDFLGHVLLDVRGDGVSEDEIGPAATEGFDLCLQDLGREPVWIRGKILLDLKTN